MKTDLLTYIKQSVAVTNLLADRGDGQPSIAFSIRPSQSGLPALVLDQVSDQPDYTQGDRSHLGLERIQFDVFASSYSDCEQVADALTPHLEALKSLTVGGTYFHAVYLDSRRDLPVTDVDGGGVVYHTTLDFQVHYKL